MFGKWFRVVVVVIAVCCLTPSVVQAASPPIPCPTGVTYTIQSGDTLTGIGYQFEVSVAELVTANRISDPDRIWVGEGLCIPVVENQPEFVRISFPKFSDPQNPGSGIETASVHITNWVCDSGRCSWEKNDWGVWVLPAWPRAFFSHREDFPGCRFPELVRGDGITLYRGWNFSGEERLRVTGSEVLGDDGANVDLEVWDALERTGDGRFAFITCHPAGDPSAPERWVVWAEKTG